MPRKNVVERNPRRERYWSRQGSGARSLLPEAVAMLGLPSTWILTNDGGATNFMWNPPRGAVLVADESGRQMFVLRPRPGGEAIRNSDSLVHVEELWEQFHHRKLTTDFLNCVVPPFEKPRYRGQIVIMRYRAQKHLDDYSKGKLVEYEHYFEAPDYADLWAVANDQYYISPGKWEIRASGITHEDEPEDDLGILDIDDETDVDEEAEEFERALNENEDEEDIEDEDADLDMDDDDDDDDEEGDDEEEDEG